MYRKEIYVFDQDQPIPAVIRNYQERDFPGLIRIQQESFPPPFPSELWWNTEQLKNHVTLFPKGALCIEVEEITDHGYIRNHNPNGNTLYVSILVCAPPIES